MNKPKYTYDDEVSFYVNGERDRLKCTGKVYIVDAFGTFEQNEEPSYDIMVDDYMGTKVLFKHIRESEIIS